MKDTFEQLLERIEQSNICEVGEALAAVRIGLGSTSLINDAVTEMLDYVVPRMDHPSYGEVSLMRDNLENCVRRMLGMCEISVPNLTPYVKVPDEHEAERLRHEQEYGLK